MLIYIQDYKYFTKFAADWENKKNNIGKLLSVALFVSLIGSSCKHVWKNKNAVYFGLTCIINIIDKTYGRYPPSSNLYQILLVAAKSFFLHFISSVPSSPIYNINTPISSPYPNNKITKWIDIHVINKY